MKTTIEPLNDRVAVKPHEAEATSRGGIIIPDTAKKVPAKGTVVAVGPGRLKDDGDRQPMSLEPGQVVLFDKYAGADIEVDGVKLKILTEQEILAHVVE